MAELYDILKPQSKYYDHKYFDTQENYNQAIKISTTVYVGNLSFFTTQDSIHQLFSKAGKVTKIIMGIDNDGNACGFCFVVYEKREQAMRAVEFISHSKLNGRVIRVDWDPGYQEGREKGRGSHGRQRRDDFRMKDDADRPAIRQNHERRGGGNRFRGRGEWRDKRERQYNNDEGKHGRKYHHRDAQIDRGFKGGQKNQKMEEEY